MIKWLWVDIGNSVEYMKVLPRFFNLICPVSFFAFACKNCFLDIFSVHSRFCDFSDAAIFSAHNNFNEFGHFDVSHGFDDFSKESMSNLIARPLMAWRRVMIWC